MTFPTRFVWPLVLLLVISGCLPSSTPTTFAPEEWEIRQDRQNSWGYNPYAPYPYNRSNVGREVKVTFWKDGKCLSTTFTTQGFMYPTISNIEVDGEWLRAKVHGDTDQGDSADRWRVSAELPTSCT